MQRIKSSLILAALLCSMAACEKSDEAQELDQAEATAALGDTESSAFYDELDAFTSEAVLSAEAEGERMLTAQAMIPACAVVNSNPDTRTITIDFGAGCTDAKGNVHKGKIIISRNGRYFTPGSTTVTSLNDYSINNIAVEGVRTLINVSSNSTSNPQFSVNLSGGKVSWPDGTFTEREVQHMRTWLRASNPLNDEWHVEGTASGKNRQGQTYNSSITSTLIVKFECLAEGFYIPIKGSLAISRPDKPILAIDFGNADCDNEVTVGMNGRSRVITVNR